MDPKEELLKIRETATFRAWREEARALGIKLGMASFRLAPSQVLQGLQVEVKKSEPACTVNPFHTPDMADGVAPGVKGLPIEAHKAALCATLLQHRVTCVHGETGSGTLGRAGTGTKPGFIELGMLSEVFPLFDEAATQEFTLLLFLSYPRIAKAFSQEADHGQTHA